MIKSLTSYAMPVCESPGGLASPERSFTCFMMLNMKNNNNK